jgi:hypothetical protein
MDLVKLIKRMRVQGMLLALLISPKAQKFVKEQGVTKTLDPNNEMGSKNGQGKGIEDLTYREKMFMGITKRYIKIESRTNALEDFKC